MIKMVKLFLVLKIGQVDVILYLGSTYHFSILFLALVTIMLDYCVYLLSKAYFPDGKAVFICGSDADYWKLTLLKTLTTLELGDIHVYMY